MRFISVIFMGFLISVVVINIVALLLNLFVEPINTTMALLNTLGGLACAYVAINVYRREKLHTELLKKLKTSRQVVGGK